MIVRFQSDHFQSDLSVRKFVKLRAAAQIAQPQWLGQNIGVIACS